MVKKSTIRGRRISHYHSFMRIGTQYECFEAVSFFLFPDCPIHFHFGDLAVIICLHNNPQNIKHNCPKGEIHQQTDPNDINEEEAKWGGENPKKISY